MATISLSIQREKVNSLAREGRSSGSIPPELLALPQWVAAGEDKVPVDPKTGAHADVTDPSTWGSYDQAVAAGLRHVGFVLTKDDPYFAIDLDKARHQDDERLHQQILEYFPTYAEYSQSDEGLHLIGRGQVPRGARRDKVEVYSDSRYMIFTGKVYRDVAIVDCQPMLDILYADMHPGPEAGELFEVEGTLDDRDVVDTAMRAKNADKFNRLCAGEWQGEYPSQSEADFALLSMFAFYTASNEQVRRLFRYSALGNRDKAERNDYLNTALRKIRANEPEPVDFSGLRLNGKGSATEKSDELPWPTCALHAPPPEPQRWTIRGFATKGELGLIVAEGGAGKSSIAFAIGCAVAGGYPLFDSESFECERAPVVYVSEEDSSDVLLNRLDALIAGHGWDRERVKSNFHFLAMHGVSLDSTEWLDHIFRIARKLRPGLIIFDPYAEVTRAKENDNDATKPLVRFWRKLAGETGATVFVVHHLGKASEGKSKLDRIRGASALNAAARMIYSVEPSTNGMKVECLKLSRAGKIPPFAIHREIEVSEDNPGEWVRATLSATSYLTARVADTLAGVAAAELFIVTQLAGGKRLTSKQLRDLSKASGVNRFDLSNAQKRLEDAGKIAYEPGARGAKHWYLTGEGHPTGEPSGPRV